MASDKKLTIISKEDAVFWMDGDGTWHNEHGKFEHPKIIQYFNRSIQKDDQGYFLSQAIDDRVEKVYFPYEETAVFAIDLKNSGESIELILNTFKSVSLNPESLYIKNDSLFLDTPEDLIKFSQKALAKLSAKMEDTDKGLTIELGNTQFIIPEK